MRRGWGGDARSGLEPVSSPGPRCTRTRPDRGTSVPSGATSTANSAAVDRLRHDGVVDPPAGPVEDTPTWTVAAVARRVGVAPATLRSWSRRYAIGPAGHRAGRYRRYTSSDVAELETMQRLAHDGMDLASAASVARRQHRGTPDPSNPDPGTPDVSITDRGSAGVDRPRAAQAVSAGEVRALVRVAQRLDADTLVHTLEASLARRDVAATWNQLCRPALTAFDGLSSGTSCIDATLVLARAVTTTLHRRFPAATVPAAPVPAGTVSASSTGRVLLACGPGEHHTLALDALLAALTEQDVPAQILGPAVPTSALLHAVEHTRPAAVFLWAQRTTTARPTVLRRLRPYVDTVVAAGPGWSTSTLDAGVRWVNTLDDAVCLARHARYAARTRPAGASTVG